MKALSKYLIAVGVFAAYSYSVFQFGAMNQREKDLLSNATATITQTQQARSTEQAMNADAWKIDQAYQKGVQEGHQRAQTLTDSLLNGSVGMYVPVRPTAAVPGRPATVVKSVKETRCELPGQTAADLTRLAQDADDIVRQSNALVDYYEDVLSRLGHPELIRGSK